MDIFSLRQIDIARALNRPKSTVCKWFRKRRVPIHELERIEKIFGFKREDLRPDVPWRKEYCKGRFGIVRTTANRGIAFAGIIENLMPQGIKILPATERQARPLTTLPGPESQALAWELAQATSQKDQPSNREVTEAVAQVKAELEAEKLRAEEFRRESNIRRKKIRELEQQIDLLKTENRIKMAMKQIQKNEIYPILQRSVDEQMCLIIQILSGERSSIDTEEYDISSIHDAYLDALWEIYDLSLFLDFTGNIDAPLP